MEREEKEKFSIIEMRGYELGNLDITLARTHRATTWMPLILGLYRIYTAPYYELLKPLGLSIVCNIRPFSEQSI